MKEGEEEYGLAFTLRQVAANIKEAIDEGRLDDARTYAEQLDLLAVIVEQEDAWEATDAERSADPYSLTALRAAMLHPDPEPGD